MKQAMHSLIFIETLCLFISLFLPGYTADDEVLDETARHAATCSEDQYEAWSYRGSNGPEHWGEMFPDCHGLKQSPISIDTGRLDSSLNLPRMTFYYRNVFDNPQMHNNGYTIELHFQDSRWRGVYVNGQFVELQNIHFHWGSNKDVGSEHVVDGVRYPLEMHLVHNNGHNNGNITAVVAVLFEEDEEINAELQHIVNEFPKLMFRHSWAQMPYRLDVMNLMPENPAAFYAYEGSLTTPGCEEGVIWIVLKAPNHVGHAQMREFRKLFSSSQWSVDKGCKLSNNFRPVQHLHRRKVYTSA